MQSNKNKSYIKEHEYFDCWNEDFSDFKNCIC